MNGMNLLPSQFRRRLLLRQRLRRWGIVWMACLTAGSAFASWEVWNLSQIRGRLAQLEEKAEPLRELSAINAKAVEDVQALEGRETILHRGNGIESPLSFITLASLGAVDAEKRLKITQISVSQFSDPKVKAAAKDAGESEGTLEMRITGIALDDVAIARFVNSILKRGVFREVKLNSSMQTEYDGEAARAYDVTCIR